MLSSEYIREPSQYIDEPRSDPLAPIEDLGHWFLSTTVHVTLGLAIGLIAARIMRALHLRWTWGGVAMCLIGASRGMLGGEFWTLGIAALSAMVRGRRWHREDVEAGADLAEIAAARLGPVEAVRRLRGSLESGGGLLATRAWSGGDRLIAGHTDSGEPVSIPFGRERGGSHTLVVGATGSGKTVTATWIATCAIAGGMGVVVVDPKGDDRMRAQLARAASGCGRGLIGWTPEGPSVYNPYARGDATEIADKALAGERFTEPHYMRQAQRYLGYEVRALQAAGLEPSLKAIVEYLDPAKLEILARGLPESRARSTYDYLDSLTPRQQSDLSGVRDRLSIMAESDFAGWLDPRTRGAVQFDLLEAVSERAVVYFDLQADRRPLLAQMLGVAIVIDLQTTVAALQHMPTPTLVVIDEFSALAAEHVTRLFGRARSAGVSLLLSTQELSDLRLPGRESVLEQVLGNLSALIAHRQIVPDSAELIARLAGSRGVWKTSHRNDGRWSRTRTTAPLVRGELVRTLPDGCAAVLDLSGHSEVRVARMISSAPAYDPGESRTVRLARHPRYGLASAARALRAVASALRAVGSAATRRIS